jgi:hypothetical protein
LAKNQDKDGVLSLLIQSGDDSEKASGVRALSGKIETKEPLN